MNVDIPRGKLSHSELENHHAFFMEKLTVSTGPFSIAIYVNVSQRVFPENRFRKATVSATN